MSLSLSRIATNAPADAANQRPDNSSNGAGGRRRGAAPRRKPRVFLHIVRGLLLLAVLSLGGALCACSSDPPPVIVTATSTASQHYVHFEQVLFDGQWSGSAGSTHGWYGPPARWGGGAEVKPHPVPSRVFVRWFDYPKQRFYEADLDLPDMPAKAAEAVGKRDSRFFYQNSLIVAVGARGEVMLWLRGYADDERARSDPNWETVQFPIELIGSGQARYASGDPIRYEVRTATARAAGKIPSEPVPSDDANE